MPNFLLAFEVCEDESVLRGFSIIRMLITAVKILVPLLIILKVSMDFGKAVIASDDGEIKKAAGIIPKRFLAGLAIFLIPTVINYILNTLVPFEQTASSFAGCTTCMTTPDECDTLIELAHVRAEAERNQIAPIYMLEYDTDQIIEDLKENGKKQQTQSTSQTYKQAVGNGKYFDSEDVTKISGLSEEEFKNVLQNSTAYKGKAKVYLPLAHDLILAEQNHSVNAFYLIGLYSYESGWLGSTLTKKCNNIGGVRYYGRTYGNGKKQTDCWNRYAGFDSISEFIDFHANMLQTRYLTPGAPHYHGTSVAAIAKDYGAGNGINTIIEIATKVSGGNASGK